MKIIMFVILFVTNLIAYGETIVFGVASNIPPYSTASGDGKGFFGFNVDLTNELCARMNVECKIVGMPFVQLMEKLNSGAIDVVSAPIPIGPDQDPRIIFSLPYLPSEGQILALRTNNNINTIDDLQGKQVGVMRYTYYDILLRSKYAKMFTLKEFTVVADMGSALMNNQIDAVIINQRSAAYIMSNMLKNFKPIGDKLTIGEGYGMFALRSNSNLIKKINQALLTMENDGSYIKIYNVYFGM